MAYIAGFSTLLLTLTSGGKIILASSAVATDALAAIVADQGVQSITGSSNELIRRLIDLPGALKLLAPLRRIHLHGEGLQYDLVSRIAAALPHAQVVTGYGLTETAGTIATAPAMRVLGRPGVCGLVLPTAKVRIVDGDGRPTPFGKVGEVEVRGEMLMRRYLGEEPNSSAFSPDGWFRPGDIGSIDAEGWLRILGRSSTTPSDETGVSLIAAEMISGQFGVGYFTWEAYSLVNYPAIVLGMLTIGVLGLGCSGAIRLLGHFTMPWLSFVNGGRK